MKNLVNIYDLLYCSEEFCTEEQIQSRGKHTLNKVDKVEFQLQINYNLQLNHLISLSHVRVSLCKEKASGPET